MAMHGKKPRGVRNNNPGNIRLNPANNWVGKVAKNTDGEFEQFEHMWQGVRALKVLIRNYIRAGHNTIEQIVSRFAPPSENKTSAYINFVSSRVGILPFMQVYDFNVDEIVKAIIQMEVGRNQVDELAIKKGLKAA